MLFLDKVLYKSKYNDIWGEYEGNEYFIFLPCKIKFFFLVDYIFFSKGNHLEF